MKKVFKIFLMFMIVFSISGCFKDKTVDYKQKDDSYDTLQYVNVRGNETLFYNVDLALKETKLFEIEFNLQKGNINTNATMQIGLNDTLKNMGLVLETTHNNKSINVYLKDQTIWFSYPLESINGGIKDSINNFIDELPAIMNVYNISNVNKHNVEDFLNDNTYLKINFLDILNGFETQLIQKYEKYEISATKGNSENIHIKFDELYRPIEFTHTTNNSSLSVSVSYPTQLTLRYPKELQGFTYFSIRNALNVTRYDSVADFLK